MSAGSTVVRHSLFAALALALAVSMTTSVLAQESTPELPEGLVDGAFVEYTNDQVATAMTFFVFQFQDERAAEEGLPAIQEIAAPQFEVFASGDAVDLTEEVQGLGDVVDEANAYRRPIGDPINQYHLFIRDGANIHYSSYSAIEPTAAGGTPGAMSESTAAAGSPIDLLVGIAESWFGDGVDSSAPLIDQLPTQDFVPEGYEESDRQESSNA